MAQPDYVPLRPSDRVRETEQLPPAKAWLRTRPGELSELRPPDGDSFGKPGPDQGYALSLAKRFEDRLDLTAGEHEEDAMSGCVAVALRRAAMFGRAPVIYDLDVAFTLFGFLGGHAGDDLVEFRKPLFQGAAHHYWDQREIVDLVLEETLRLTPIEVKQRLGDWRSMLVADAEE